MAYPFVLKIDGVDFSDCVMQTEDISEKPTYINGPNTGTSKVGTPIWDRIRTTYAFEQALKPLTRDRLSVLAAACEPNEVVLTYRTFTDPQIKTVRAQLKLSSFKFAVDSWAGPIYNGGTISAEILDA